MRANVNYKTKKIEIEVSSIELEQLDDFKKEKTKYLNDLIKSYEIEIDLLTSVHYDIEPKKFELINLRYHLIMNENYNKFYKDIIIFENGFVRFNNVGKEFLSFANAYNILEDENRGVLQLVNILKIKVLEWLIEDYNKHPENEYFVQYKLPKDYYNKDYLNVFKPYGFELFCFLNDNLESNLTPPVKFTIIYHFMLNKRFLRNTKKDYLDFIKENFRGQLIRKNNEPYKYNKIENIEIVRVNYNNAEIELKSLLSQFETIRKLKSKVE
ncbi:hypothetical protein IU405_07545 [Polaribacter sp. BAL334]|uniref:hypothetical protein n=1 Tax=Polaribacter sp. BAL334 TaxID=1708178 RepID=UPI0018D21122|nr:hypothetical protein [Polaribacter sp. BAL334]MBG7612100.1 hypothetical protein [Polaribacter sp. BAL334]